MQKLVNYLLHCIFPFRFYMPHGLTVDHASNIWLTDVGSHQVRLLICFIQCVCLMVFRNP